ncbi:MAG: MGMT family protein [Acidimicrobiales bacterium]
MTTGPMNYAPPPDRQLYFEQIWAQAREIPYGRVATYGQLTKLVTQPQGISDEDYSAFASRWAGLAMAACPDDVPWHRVVNSQGKISNPAAAKQQQRLEAEGIVFVNDKISLADYQWREPGHTDEPTQGRLFG